MSYKCWRSEDCLFYKWEIMFWANNIFLWKCRTFSFSMSQVEPWHKGLPKVFFYFFIFCGSKTLNFSNSLYFIKSKAFSSGVHAFIKREKFTTFFFSSQPAHALKFRLHKCLCQKNWRYNTPWNVLYHHNGMREKEIFIMHQLVVMCFFFSLRGCQSMWLVFVLSVTWDLLAISNVNLKRVSFTFECAIICS